MSNDVCLLVTVVAAGTIAFWLALRTLRRAGTRAGAWLPETLRRSRPAYVERTFRSETYPFIVARVDRAYRNPQGTITLVELKTRRHERVQPSDIIELSAQRIALSSQTGEAVASSAYVVVDFAGGLRTHRVDLMSGAEVEDLVRRREGLLAGRLVPRPTRRPGLCATCSYRPRCRRGMAVVYGDEGR